MFFIIKKVVVVYFFFFLRGNRFQTAFNFQSHRNLEIFSISREGGSKTSSKSTVIIFF